MKNVVPGTCLVWLLLLSGSARGQVDIAGDWDQPNAGLEGRNGYAEDGQDRGSGPDLGDYAGLPLNDALRFKASLYSPSWLTVPEHQCLPHPATYQYRSPGPLSIHKVYDPVTQRLVAYNLYGSYGLARVIWMDGRPRPPVNAPHTYNGFSLGRWEGNRLVVETSHIKYGFIRRNGVSHSDRVRLLEQFIRHDDVLTIVTAVDDPVYFDEPVVRSMDYRANRQANLRLSEFGGFVNGGGGDVFYKCAPIDELDVDRYRVPSYMPGANSELDMFSKKRHVPMEAALGGTQTIYPEYQTRLRQLLAGTAPAAAPASTTARRAANPAVEGVTSQHLAGQVWMITANGRNVVVQIGSEGVMVVDPGAASVADAVRAEIEKLAPGKTIRVLVNTSADPQLSGGNARMSAGASPTSQRAMIIAHEATGMKIVQSGVVSQGIPTEVFFRGTREVYFNDEPIEVTYVPAAHSNGDVLVHFRKSDVLAVGHVIEDLTYPTIGDGGSLQGTIDALNYLLSRTVASWRSQGGTLVVPVRGRPYDEGDVAEYRDTVTIIRDRLADAIRKGHTLAQIKADRLTRDYDGRYGMEPGPGSTESFIDAAYASLNAARTTR